MRRSMQWVSIGLCTFSLLSGGLVFAQSIPGAAPDTGMSKPTMPDPGKTGTSMEKATKPGMMPDTGMSKPMMTDPGKAATGAAMEKGKMAPGMEMSKPGPVDLNTADEKTLTSLKGVGPKKAKAIMKYRQESGGFKSVDELKNVPGFGEKTLASLKPLVTVGTMSR